MEEAGFRNPRTEFAVGIYYKEQALQYVKEQISADVKLYMSYVAICWLGKEWASGSGISTTYAGSPV